MVAFDSCASLPEGSPKMVDAQKSGSFFWRETDDKITDFEVTEIEIVICRYGGS